MLELTANPYRNLAPVYDQLGLSEKSAGYARLVAEFLKERAAPGKMLDLGCGTGKAAIIFSLSGWDATGLDISQEMIAIARLQALEAQTKVNFIRQDMRALSAENQFSLVTCFSVLNHLKDSSELEKVIQAASKATVEGGFVAGDLFSPGAFSETCPEVRMAPNVYLIELYSWRKEGLLSRQLIWFRKKGDLFEKKEALIEERAFPASDFLNITKKHSLYLEKRWRVDKEPEESEEGPHSLFLFQKRP